MPAKLDRQRFAEWLNRHWTGNKVCPICGNNNWSVPEELVEVRPFSGGTLVLGGRLFPHAIIICKVCGHTLLFNAMVAGLVKPEAEETKQ